MGKSVSKVFEAIGNVITEPVRDTYNFVTGSPKENSIGDIWNNAVGPGNDTQVFAEQTNPLGQAVKKAGLGDWAAPLQAPTWDDLATPGQAFSQYVDQQNKILPDIFQPYAQPLESAALSVFNPFVGAAFQTAYQGGKEQEQQKGFDWGELGKNAAINFGTAAVSSGANKLLSNANAASAAKNAAALQPTDLLPGSVTNAGNAANNANILGAFQPEIGAATNFAPNVTASALAANSANAFNAIGAIPQTVANTASALNSFSTPLNSSTASSSLLPKAQAVQSSGIGDAAYKAAVSTGSKLANSAITNTLAPEGAQPIAGTMDNFGVDGGGAPADNQSQWGDLLNAFGGNEINVANPNGPRIDATGFNNAVDRLSANNYLQQSETRDKAIPAGQYQPEPNTPYSNRLSEINKGTTQAYADLLDQVNNANKYYGVIDSNPGLTSEQLDAYLNDPSGGVLGNFQIPEAQADYFKGIRTLGPRNLSLVQ